jgi:(1->4)-alpha-D-glucan 1-alpha-D-glucosylmutase
VSLALVDPDNRRCPDFDKLEADLERGLASIPEPGRDPAAAKARVTATSLRLRRERPELFDGTSSYEPIVTSGPRSRHVVGFLRRDSRGRPVAVLATRFALTLADSGGWDADTSVRLPEGRWNDMLAGRRHDVGASGAIAGDMLGSVESGGWPVALLVPEG